jgi:phage shock protein A
MEGSEFMSETIIARVKRIVSGNLNELIDRLEKSQAEIVMKEAIREVDRAIEDVRSAQGKSLLKSKQIENQVISLKSKLSELSQKILFAIDQQRDDLAKAAITRQLDLEMQIGAAEKINTELLSEQKNLAECASTLAIRKSEMEDALKLLAQAHSAVEETGLPSGSNNVSPLKRAETASSAFNRVLDLTAGLETKVHHPEASIKMAELDKLSFEQQLESRLQAAKELKKSA